MYTYICNRQLIRTYCIAQRTPLSALKCPTWEWSLQQVDICICVAELLHCTAEITQPCKSTVQQKKKKKKDSIKHP